ncbi:MAG: hypothetical protein ABI878_11510 [Acidobacteriota bacterium]
MADVKMLKFLSVNDFDPSLNKETKPPVAIGGKAMLPLIEGKTIDTATWLGNDDQHIYLFQLMLSDGSGLVIRPGADGSAQVIHRPRY